MNYMYNTVCGTTNFKRNKKMKFIDMGGTTSNSLIKIIFLALVVLNLYITVAAEATLPEGADIIFEPYNWRQETGYFLKIKLPNRISVNNDSYGVNICAGGLERKEFQVACKQIGFDYVSTYEYTPVERSEGESGVGIIDCYPYTVTCSGIETNLQECQFTKKIENTTQDASLYLECARGDPPQEGSVRLFGSNRPYAGRLEIFLNNTWGGVCSQAYFFGYPRPVADVLCHELGFGQSIDPIFQNHTALEAKEFGFVHSVDFSCDGREVLLRECNISRHNFSYCSPRWEPLVYCVDKPIDILPVRLSGGSSPTEGFVNVLVNGVWGTVCKVHWDFLNAVVVCRQLGYQFPMKYVNWLGSPERAKMDYSTIFLDAVVCDGNESSLISCEHKRLGAHNCDRTQDVRIKCAPLQDINDAEIILEASGQDSGYFLKIKLPYRTSEDNNSNNEINVCEGGLQRKELEVACKQLGFDYLSSYEYAPLESAWNISNIGKVDCFPYILMCSGNELNLNDCQFAINEETNFVTTRDTVLYIECANGRPPQEGSVRLQGSDLPYQGYLQIFMNNIWGGICWTSYQVDLPVDAADVVCRELGYGLSISTAYQNISAIQAKEFGFVHSIDFRCDGTEASLRECNITHLDPITCSPSVEARVYCVEDPYNSFPVRLVGGSSPDEGTLNIQVNGVWGTVCDDKWSFPDSVVACRELGYDFPLYYDHLRSPYGLANNLSTIFLDDLNCKGTESSLLSCEHRRLGDHNCGHYEDVSLKCSFKDGYEDFSVAMFNSGTFNGDQGAVLVYHEGQWRTICSEEWAKENSDVVCRQLGFKLSSDNYFLGISADLSSVDILDKRVVCSGSENTLVDCSLTRPVHPCETDGIVIITCTNYQPFTFGPARTYPPYDGTYSGFRSTYFFLIAGVFTIVITVIYYLCKCICATKESTLPQTPALQTPRNYGEAVELGTPILIPAAPLPENDLPPTYDDVDKNPHLYIPPPSTQNGAGAVITPPPAYTGGSSPLDDVAAV